MNSFKFLVIAIVVIVVVVVFDRISEKPGSLPENAFEYNIDSFISRNRTKNNTKLIN